MRRLLTKLPLPSHVMKGLSRRQWHRVYSAAWQYVVQGHLDRQWQRIDTGLPAASDEHAGLHRLNSRVAHMLQLLVRYPLIKRAADSDAGLMPSLQTVDGLREAIRWELRRKRRYMLDQHLISLAQLEALESLALAVERGLANKTDAMRGALRATQLKVAMDERVRRRLQPPPPPPPPPSESSESESSPTPPAGADKPPPQPSGRRSRRRKRAAAAAQLEEPSLDKPERGSTRRMGRAGTKIVNEASGRFHI
eukprot:COSAG01_NODE_2309_length_7942_cov_7.425602_10_plen_252_part_00